MKYNTDLSEAALMELAARLSVEASGQIMSFRPDTIEHLGGTAFAFVEHDAEGREVYRCYGDVGPRLAAEIRDDAQ
jgi:hypothetical protein